MGGATLSALTLIEEMQKRSYNVLVLCPNMGTELKNKLARSNIRWEVLRFGFYSFPSNDIWFHKWVFTIIKTILKNQLAVHRIYKIIRDNNIDIVHTNVGPITCGFDASRKAGVPHVWHLREYGDIDFNIKMFPSKSVFRWKLRKSFVISITNDLIRYNKLDNYKNAFVIYNGVRKKDDLFLSYNKQKYFLCASRVSPEKGFNQIVRVFANFHKQYPDYSLKIIGLDNNNYVSELLNQAKSLNVDSAIFYEGYQNDVSAFMSKAKALLVASPYEGFGRMTAEAAFAGCLVVGKNTAGTKEIMDITGGFSFMTDEEMMNSMVAVTNLTDEEYYEKVSYAQKQAVEYFSEESYVNNVLCLYNSITNNHKIEIT